MAYFLDKTGLDTLWAKIKSTFQTLANKVTSIRAVSSASDDKYPSEKAVATALYGKQPSLPTTGAASTTYAINISGNAATATDAGTGGNLATAVANSHTHSNKSVLDGITATDVSNWNAGITDTVTIARGGTGATTAAAARTNLDVPSKAEAKDICIVYLNENTPTFEQAVAAYNAGKQIVMAMGEQSALGDVIDVLVPMETAWRDSNNAIEQFQFLRPYRDKLTTYQWTKLSSTTQWSISDKTLNAESANSAYLANTALRVAATYTGGEKVSISEAGISYEDANNHSVVIAAGYVNASQGFRGALFGNALSATSATTANGLVDVNDSSNTINASTASQSTADTLACWAGSVLAKISRTAFVAYKAERDSNGNVFGDYYQKKSDILLNVPSVVQYTTAITDSNWRSLSGSIDVTQNTKITCDVTINNNGSSQAVIYLKMLYQSTSLAEMILFVAANSTAVVPLGAIYTGSGTKTVGISWQVAGGSFTGSFYQRWLYFK